MADLIDRQQAIDAIDRFNVCGYVEEPWEKLRDTLQELPPAQPQRKMGKWIQLYDNTWMCDNCEQTEQFGENIESTSNFCPNCGADMRGEQDDESRSNSNAQTDTRARGMGTTDKSSGI